ncbi:unnamed protein product [Rhizoctonia solani]|uniref:Protein kinase domain-containing protein n=1 Tax=Rhizoctonia solani TaxID=456999 RepID=A0A8H2XKD6_9AGAM|nr:unnamed protein product [Rhizoctonia solani]
MTASNNDNSFSLRCFVWGDDPLKPFTVRVSPDLDVQEFLLEVKRTYESLRDDKLAHVTLYRIEAAREELANLDAPSRGSPNKLAFMDPLRVYWPEPQEISWDRVQVLVQADIIRTCVPSSTVHTEKRELNNPTEDDQNRELIERFRKSRASYCNALTRCSASAAAKPNEFLRQQQGQNYMLNGRPRQHTGPPLVLYHPVFGNFLSNLQSSDPLCPQFYEHIFGYLWDSQKVYEDEVENGQASDRDASGLEQLLGKLLKSGVAPDAVATASDGGYCLIVEMKNEIGTGGSDPSIQAAQSYSRVWQTSRLLDRCCCPTILIAIAGPWMCILGAVFLDRPVIQPLTDYLWVGINPSKPQEIHYVARVFHCILEARRELETYYDDLTSKDINNFPAQPFIFPHPTHFIDGNGQQVKFTYVMPLDIPSPDVVSQLKRSESQITPNKPIYVAKLRNSGLPIVVKFVESYNSDAHRLLAREGLAPALLYDGTAHANDQLGPNHHMIVMEHVNGVDLGHYVGPILPPCVSANIEHALSLLHDADIVFGDLRPPNIMLVKDGDGTITGAKLIDFDWCGKHRVGR